MATEPTSTFSLASVVEEVLQQHGGRSDVNSASRNAEETSLRRYEAAGWLRKTVGVVKGKDLPAEPSEEDFRIGLRSGIILCSVLNKIQPGSVPNVVEGPRDSVIIPDGAAALSAFQYFENVRKFLAVMEEMGLPTFQVSDLEQGGNSSRIVDCVLELKSYAERKLGGASGSGKYSGVSHARPPISGKPLQRKNSEPFMNSLWTMPSGDRDGYMSDPGQDRSEKGSFSLNSLVRQYLSDKKPEEIPIIVESLLSKVMEEFEHHMQIRHEMRKTTQVKAPSETDCSVSEPASISEREKEKEDEHNVPDDNDAQDEHEVQEEQDIQDEHNEQNKQEESNEGTYNEHEKTSHQISISKQQKIVEQQNRSIQELKNSVRETKLGMQNMQNEHQKEIINLSKHIQSLASAASGYHKVLEENRKLYNVVQDLKGNIRVYCRVRPFLGGQPSHYSSVGSVEDGSISIITPSKNGKEGKKTFTFNRAFAPTATQGEVFQDTQPLIRSVLDGYNVCIFAYGQTGSGKTFTMSGPDDLNEETIGVNYRALGDLFYLSEQRKDTISYEISVQMLEIYNEQVRDLLTTDEIRNSSLNGINVPDANLVPVSCTSDVINLMNLGHKNRAVGSTAMNDRSSRSHSCLTVHVQGKNLTSGSTIRGSMHLVDLAGSERADKTEATGDRLKEAQHINKSLSALGDVISSLAQKSPHVPYRNSKLTQLLQDSLGGQAKTLMFVHISPEPEALGETLSTLKFAERVSSVELGAARVNKESSDVKELKEQIASLKAALARKEGGEAENFHQSVNSSGNETPKLKSYSSSPPIQQRSSIGGSRKLTKDDSGSPDSQKNVALQLKRRSLDLHDMSSSNSQPWRPATSPGKEDDKESISGDWVDKISMKRNDSLTSDDSLVGQWEVESKQSSPRLSPTFLSETSKICLDNSLTKKDSLDNSLNKKDSQDNEDLQRHGFDTTTTDESDEHEIATVTSDSSEVDLHWPVPIPKPITVSSGLGIKAKKKTNLRSIKNTDSR
ncbi:unnamed protein product [Sphenostylis stenocarpa]|uniref:Kinesin-like protein n=1 Tax=Sphenostylis stenocarpa TaxID=92480 RepID=A0AA86RWC5_9FABA|nr:unnamed protein product [Sphenostylis stenocarpa]